MVSGFSVNAIILSMTYVVIGLGNPGGEYAKTRHNAGRMAVERMAKLLGFPSFELKKTAQALLSEGMVDGSKVQLVLPEVYMNLSGKVIPSFVKSKTAARRLLIIRDDLDMPLGTMKMTVSRGSGGHKGVESIMRALVMGPGRSVQGRTPIKNEAVVCQTVRGNLGDKRGRRTDLYFVGKVRIGRQAKDPQAISEFTL
jgi:PTH1 family peptidyl-tRNA hydrolase